MFSRRNERQPDVYHYHFPQEVRSRLLHAIQHAVEGGNDGMTQVSFPDVMFEVEQFLLRKHGGLRRSGFEAARISDIPAVEHFFKCQNEEVMDFLEFCFKTKFGCGKQKTVEELNEILEECNVGYELTPYVENWTKGAEFMGRFQENVMKADVTLPKAIRKDEKVLHAETVKPSLAALSAPAYANARRELEGAFDEYQAGKYADAITDAGSAFESVLKIICTERGWAFDPQRDTCSKLLDICRENELFPPFYKPILEGAATVRNKLGDAHGKGPSTIYQVNKAMADHMIYMVCNNINLLMALANPS